MMVSPPSCDPLKAVKFFDMTEGFAPVGNVLGVGDPDVHKIDGRWVMFLGGFTTRFRNNLFQAVLPAGVPLSSNAWSLLTSPDDPRRAVPLIAQPDKNAWDGYGLHTPSYVSGIDSDRGPQERVYYAGRSSPKVTGSGSRYAIGLLRMTAKGWVRQGDPVLTGTPERPSVLEPLVRFDEGRWRMWYLSAINEIGRGELPNYQVEYVESENGVSGWSQPHVLFSVEDGFFDNCVIAVEGGYEMVVARGGNLFGMNDFPPQGMWWLRSRRPSGDRADWTREPVQILDAGANPMPWFANGVFGPSIQYGDTAADRDVMYVFFGAVYETTRWLRLAARRLLSLRTPPVPAPYYFAIGRMQCIRTRSGIGGC